MHNGSDVLQRCLIVVTARYWSREDRGIERLDAQAHVTHVVPCTRRAAFRPIDFGAHGQQIYQRTPGSHLDQPEFALLLFDRATQHSGVELDHGVEVCAPNHDVIDLAATELHGMSPVLTLEKETHKIVDDVSNLVESPLREPLRADSL